jgi:hypothetical protein
MNSQKNRLTFYVRSFSRFKHHIHVMLFSDSIFLKCTSLKKRYASPIGFSGLCSPERVTFQNIQQQRVCAVFVAIQRLSQWKISFWFYLPLQYISTKKQYALPRCSSGLCFTKTWRTETYGRLNQTIWHRAYVFEPAAAPDCSITNISALYQGWAVILALCQNTRRDSFCLYVFTYETCPLIHFWSPVFKYKGAQ